MMYPIGPFDGRTQNPTRPGVYFTSPFEDGDGGGYGYWDGTKWNKHRAWGGWYWENPKRPWYWFGLREEQSRDPHFAR